MRIAYPPDLEAAIRGLIDRGRYPDEAAVLRAAVQALEVSERRLDDLRAKVRVGINEADRGELAKWTPELRELILQSARRRSAEGDIPDPDVCP